MYRNYEEYMRTVLGYNPNKITYADIIANQQINNGIPITYQSQYMPRPPRIATSPIQNKMIYNNFLQF